MSRRRFISTSEDYYEPPTDDTLEGDIDNHFRLLSLLDSPATIHTNQPPAPPLSELARILTANSIVSTSSSFSAQQNKARGKAASNNPVRKIGAGACGAVFSQDGHPLAYKVGKTGASDDDALWTDFSMHQRIIEALKNSDCDIEIPECHFFVGHADSEWWDAHPSLVAAAAPVCNLPARVLVSERILPLPAPVRSALINSFCKDTLRDAAAADPSNKDCLVRVYLGSTSGRTTSFFSLRNFKLHLNQMIEMGLDCEALAVSMGTTLGLIHWKAKTDARDIEFALGSSATRISGNDNFERRQTRLFVLDFNQVRDITMDDAGVELAVQAFSINDPYYPRPHGCTRVEKELWNSFVRSYLDSSNKVLDEEYRILPRKFLAGLIKKYKPA
ncbi:exodeoxyribonuclease iii xth [Ophiostoma piceae UAMH 11346]|uniref:Exodeoxyribonuclease iii xth n=1 Tax=Ophiostoma piceae (strain UAMH 11346) TaxID=1262450 RepID=S3BZ92_OPHP1|nr:exodeoxyribonuclease iii xth [Ophiostoma piceae UAMH 11346]